MSQFQQGMAQKETLPADFPALKHHLSFSQCYDQPIKYMYMTNLPIHIIPNNGFSFLQYM